MSAVAEGVSRSRALAVLAGTLAGLVGVGWLCHRAFFERATPDTLPTIAPPAPFVADAPGRAPPFLLAVVDGVRAETAADGPDPAMPFFVSLGREGVAGIAMAGEPTLTVACVRTLLTGRNPDMVAGLHNFNAPPVEGDLIGFLAARGARPAHGGDASIVAMTGRHYDPKDVLAFPDRGPSDQGDSDDQAVPFVLDRIADGADLVTLHLLRPDHAAHKWGAAGPEYRDACRVSDGQLARVIGAFRSRHPDATVLVAADHGVTPRGTHGGGEPGARRAPFVLVGPRIARLSGVEIEQSAIAPTVAAALGLPQPPLAESPPEVRLTTRPDAEKAAALDAYLRARIAVADRLGWTDAAQMVESKRAQAWIGSDAKVATSRLADLYGVLSKSAFSGTGVWPVLFALLAAVAWLGALVRLRDGGRGLESAARSDGRALPFAALAAIPILGGAAAALRDAFDAEAGVGAAPARLGIAVAVLAFVGLALLARRSTRDAWRRLAGGHPTLVAALACGAVGFALTLRPFVEPVWPGAGLTAIVFAALALAAVARLATNATVRARAPRAGLAVLAIAVVLFAGGRVVEVLGGGDWARSAFGRSSAWEIAIVGVAGVLAWDGARRRRSGTRTVALVVAGIAFAAALGLRLGGPGALWTVALVAAPAAFVLAAFDADADRRLDVRLLAALAIGRLLEDSAAAGAVLALVALGARIAATLPAARTRVGIAGLAVLLLLVRIAAFHAMGNTESVSTFDVAAVLAPDAVARGAAAMVGVHAVGTATGGWTVEEAGSLALLLLRFAVPWLLLLAAAARAFDRERASDGLRALVADLAIGFAARGAAIAVAMWVWWSSSWWTWWAQPVYLLSVGEVLLLAAALAATGGFRGSRPAPVTPAGARVLEPATA